MKRFQVVAAEGERMSTLVTGAAGFVGRHVVHALLARHVPVRAFVREQSQAAPLRDVGAEVVLGDIRNAADAGRAVQGTSVVHHCAALVGHAKGHGHSKPEVYDVNLGGVRNVLDALKQQGSGRMILLSSINTLGTRDIERATEDLPTRRENEPHADVKIDAEELAASCHRDHGVDVVVLRPGLIYGPGDRNIPRLVETLQRGKFKFIGSRENIVPIVHVDDLVQAMLKAADTPAAGGNLYHVTDGSRTTIGELVDHLVELTACAAPKKVLPRIVPQIACSVFEGLTRAGLWRKAPPINRVTLRFLGTSRWVDISKARSELGYAPQTTLREGLAALFRRTGGPGAGDAHARDRLAS